MAVNLRRKYTVSGSLEYNELVPIVIDAQERIMSAPANPFATARTATTDNCSTHVASVFPEELACAIVDFLEILKVKSNEVVITEASSDRKDYDLSCVLSDDDKSWWMSENGSLSLSVDGNDGKKDEIYLQFQLSTDRKPRRVRSLFIRIPPLPFGPLSLCEFRVDYSLDSKRWVSCDHLMRTASVHGLQRFDLPEIDAIDVRLVCLSNHGARFRQGSMTNELDCVGLYTVLWR